MLNLAMIYSALHDVRAPITKVYAPSQYFEGGFLVDNRYLVQLSKHTPTIMLNVVYDNGQISKVVEFRSINDLIQHIMEN